MLLLLLLLFIGKQIKLHIVILFVYYECIYEYISSNANTHALRMNFFLLHKVYFFLKKKTKRNKHKLEWEKVFFSTFIHQQSNDDDDGIGGE